MKVSMQIVIAITFCCGCIYVIEASPQQQSKFGSRIKMRNGTLDKKKIVQTGLAATAQYPIPDSERKYEKPSTLSPAAQRRNEVVLKNNNKNNFTKVSSQIYGNRGVEAAIDAIFFGSSKTADIIKKSLTGKTTTTRTTTTTTTTSVPLTNENEIKRQIDFNRIANGGKKSGQPPKKYISPGKDERQRKDKIKNSTRIENGPTKYALNILTESSTNRSKNVSRKVEKDKRASAVSTAPRERFNCPRENEVKFELFPLKCSTDKDCKSERREEICCEIFGAKSCVAGITKPLEESSHSPAIFGFIPRKCPERPLAELWWELKTCQWDSDCWPRVCCPDGRQRYCRTAQPQLESVPVPVKRSINYLSEYLECTPPPPPIFDLHPKSCNSTLDCFPNVCCQEAGKKHCRPPKKSVLTLMANVLNVGFIKRLTQNIVIK